MVLIMSPFSEGCVGNLLLILVVTVTRLTPLTGKLKHLNRHSSCIDKGSKFVKFTACLHIAHLLVESHHSSNMVFTNVVSIS